MLPLQAYSPVTSPITPASSPPWTPPAPEEDWDGEVELSGAAPTALPTPTPSPITPAAASTSPPWTPPAPKEDWDHEIKVEPSPAWTFPGTIIHNKRELDGWFREVQAGTLTCNWCGATNILNDLYRKSRHMRRCTHHIFSSVKTL